MTILITGATGFIGRHVCAQLTSQDTPVLALMRRPRELPALRQRVEQLGGKGELVAAVAGDLDRPGLGLTTSLPELTAVVHLGARFAWGMDQDTARRTNVDGSLSAANLARERHCRLIYISGFMLENSDHLQRLGINTHDLQRTNWNQVYHRAGAYEASKLEAALRVREFASQSSLDWVEVQPATVAGASNSGELDPSQPLFNLIENLDHGRLALVPGSEAHWLPLVAVDDLARLIAAAIRANNPPPRLLALDARSPNLRGLLATIATTLGRRPPRRHLPMKVLALLLRIPGLPALMNTAPEALNFIQTTRFDTSVTETFSEQQGLELTPVQQSVQASARYYQASTSRPKSGQHGTTRKPPGQQGARQPDPQNG